MVQVMKKQIGLSLIETMISLVIGLVVLGSTVGIYIVVIKGSSNTSRSIRLNHDMEAAMNLMVNDIRRAGYWSGANVNANSLTNPFTSTTQMTNLDIQDNGSSIIYSYDSPDPNESSIPNSSEYYGFKLFQGENGGIIKLKPPSTWAAFTNDEQLDITYLNFSFVGELDDRCVNTTNSDRTCSTAIAGDKLAEKRIIDITMTGRLVSDPNVTHTLTNRVEVRNNYIYTKQ